MTITVSAAGTVGFGRQKCFGEPSRQVSLLARVWACSEADTSREENQDLFSFKILL